MTPFLVRSTSRVGVDVGRVLCGAAGDDGEADTSFLHGQDDDALRTPPVPGGFETVRLLAERTGGNVWLVSKCGPRIEALTRRWLAHQGFHTLTGLGPDHLRFCRKRPEKRAHAEALSLTHFVDDRLDVLRPLDGLVPALVWFGVQKEPAPGWVRHAPSWAVARTLLLGETA